MDVFGVRVRIRPVCYDDLLFLRQLWNDGAVMRYHGYPDGMHVTEAGMEHWWSQSQAGQHPHATDGVLASPHCLITLADGTAIGEFSYSIDAQQRARVDLRLVPEQQGHGYAVETLRLALCELFATTVVSKIVVEPSPDNAPAMKLLRRCGFITAPTDNHPRRWECTRAHFADCAAVNAA